MIKLKSSAVLIALFAGSVLTAILALSTLSAQKTILSVSTSTDAAIASAAAESGLEVGKQRYNSLEQNPHLLYRKSRDIKPVEISTISGKKENYFLSTKMEALAYGENFSASRWYSNAREAEKDHALLVKTPHELKIDLEYLFKFAESNQKPTRIEIKFSDAYEQKK